MKWPHCNFFLFKLVIQQQKNQHLKGWDMSQALDVRVRQLPKVTQNSTGSECSAGGSTGGQSR